MKRLVILGLLFFIFAIAQFDIQTVSADYEDVEDPIVVSPYD